jgi:hypothetical protein
MNTITKKHFCVLFLINKLTLKLYAITIRPFPLPAQTLKTWQKRRIL